jgi:hypothetical protein
MIDAAFKFMSAYMSSFSNKIVYTDKIPEEMTVGPVDKEGWVEWKPIKGTLSREAYEEVEKQFNVRFPASFIDWHRAYFFLDGDCRLIRLPSSNPQQPLREIRSNLNWVIPQQLIPEKLYPFASEGNDTGPLVFDARFANNTNDFPIRVYDLEFGGNLNGLSDPIFSSFTALIECVTHFLVEISTREDFEIIPDFFKIDPQGAGRTGIDYWLSWCR